MPSDKEKKDLRKLAKQVQYAKERLVKMDQESGDSLKQSKDSIKVFVKSILNCIYDMPKQRLEMITSAVVEVFEAAGSDLFAIQSRIESIVVLDAPFAFCRAVHWPDPDLMEDRVQIVFPLMPDWSEDTLKYYISHELGHAVLHHFELPAAVNAKVRSLCEIAADALAESWGFPLPKSPNMEKPQKKKPKS